MAHTDYARIVEAGKRRVVQFVVRGVPALFLMLSLSGCISAEVGAGHPDEEETERREDERQPSREYLFDTPEHSVMDTPWFTVSSVVLQIRRTQPETVIMIPDDSDMQRYLALPPRTGHHATTIPGNRFVFSLGIMTDGVPPFAPDPDRYRYPYLYE